MPVARMQTMVRFGNVSWEAPIYATTQAWPYVRNWPVAQGRFFTHAEDRNLVPLVIIGQKVKERFFGGHENPLGQQLLIGNASFQVAGVMAEKGAESGESDYDDVVIVPYYAGIYRLFADGRSFDPTYVMVQALNSSVVLAAQESIETLMRKRHGREDFAVSNSAARLQAEAQAKDSMTVMLSLIAAVSLVVGGIGVMNVMLMTVRERTREIGIRMATGARPSDILRQFLTESVLVSMVGGVVGVLAGMVVALTLAAWNVPIVFSLSALVLSFGCAVFTGLVFGFMPARTAAQLDPVVALAGG